MTAWRKGAVVSVVLHGLLFFWARGYERPPRPTAADDFEQIEITILEPPVVEPRSEPSIAEAPPLRGERTREVDEQNTARADSRERQGSAPASRDSRATARADGADDRQDRARAAVDGSGTVRANGADRADAAIDGSGSARAEVAGDGSSIGPHEEALSLVLAPRAPTVSDAPLIAAGPSGAPAADPNLRPSGGGTLTYEQRSFTGYINHDGTVEFEDHLAGYTGLGMWFDVTDTVMALAGDDAYASVKLRMLDATREQRLAMAADACEERLDQSLYGLRSDLEALWRDKTVPMADKKRIIFQLWDDCAEDGAKSAVEHGDMARATIIAFVNRRLPRGGAVSFSSEELISLNARRHSSQVFEPYQRQPRRSEP